ncbi:hypothetical protein [Vibrio nigripulchritudo]|uniref:hypothetical protein n=1 Tax=Vibrio nigripulchritudo TaxID=28173 RepID=UPI00066E12E0|nr:hypothetical protein [Vibrio nigripulchritudo]
MDFYDPFSPKLETNLSSKNSNRIELNTNLVVVQRNVADYLMWLPVGVTFNSALNLFTARRIVRGEVLLNKSFSVPTTNSIRTKSDYAIAAVRAIRVMLESLRDKPIDTKLAKESKGGRKAKSDSINVSIVSLKPKKKTVCPALIFKIRVTLNGIRKDISRSINLRDFDLETVLGKYAAMNELVPTWLAEKRKPRSNELNNLTPRTPNDDQRALALKDIRTALKLLKENYAEKKRFVQVEVSDEQSLILGNSNIVVQQSSFSGENDIYTDVVELLRIYAEKNFQNIDHDVYSCTKKIQPTTGVPGLMVTIDKRRQAIVVQAIIGKKESGSYLVKKYSVKAHGVKGAFTKAIDTHFEAFNLETHNSVKNRLYSTFMGHLVQVVPKSLLQQISQEIPSIVATVVKGSVELSDTINNVELHRQKVLNTPDERTGTIGMKLRVSRTRARLHGLIGFDEKTGPIYRRYALDTHGIKKAFYLAKEMYIESFDLPKLSKNELDDAYRHFFKSVTSNVSCDLHYKFNKGYLTEAPQAIKEEEKPELTRSERRKLGITQLKQLNKRLTLLKESKDYLTDDYSDFGFESPLEFNFLANCTGCGEKPVESRSEDQHTVSCNTCFTKKVTSDSNFKARSAWALLNWQDVSVKRIPHFYLNKRSLAANKAYLERVLSFIKLELEIASIRTQIHRLAIEHNVKEMKVQKPGQSFQTRLEAYLEWAKLAERIIERDLSSFSVFGEQYATDSQ